MIGADSPHKQELSAQLLQRADRVVLTAPNKRSNGEIFSRDFKGLPQYGSRNRWGLS